MIKNKPLFYTGLTMFIAQVLLFTLVALDTAFPGGVSVNTSNAIIGGVFVTLMFIASIVIMIIGTYD